MAVGCLSGWSDSNMTTVKTACPNSTLTKSWHESPGAIPCWFLNIHTSTKTIWCVVSVLYFFFQYIKQQHRHTYRYTHFVSCLKQVFFFNSLEFQEPPAGCKTKYNKTNTNEFNDCVILLWRLKKKKNKTEWCFNTWIKQEKLWNGTLACPFAMFVSMYMTVVITLWPCSSNLQLFHNKLTL